MSPVWRAHNNLSRRLSGKGRITITFFMIEEIKCIPMLPFQYFCVIPNCTQIVIKLLIDARLASSFFIMSHKIKLGETSKRNRSMYGIEHYIVLYYLHMYKYVHQTVHGSWSMHGYYGYT